MCYQTQWRNTALGCWYWSLLSFIFSSIENYEGKSTEDEFKSKKTVFEEDYEEEDKSASKTGKGEEKYKEEDEDNIHEKDTINETHHQEETTRTKNRKGDGHDESKREMKKRTTRESLWKPNTILNKVIAKGYNASFLEGKKSMLKQNEEMNTYRSENTRQWK